MGTQPSCTSLSVAGVFRLVEEELKEVDSNLKILSKSSVSLIDSVNTYMHSGGGKRLRPTTLLLCAKLAGKATPAAVKLAGVVELIHAATLVHDDIIDNANLRRGRASANAKWGNQITVLTGDWMYMTAFYIALELQNFEILDILINVTRTMVEGELIQLEQSGSLDLSVDDYVDVCSKKTACLFSACTRLGAIVSGTDGKTREKLTSYGRDLGLAFQFTDDLLDYTSDRESLGKPVLKDLEEGRVTLPIITLRDRAGTRDRQFLREVVEQKDFSPANKRRIIEMVENYNALDELRRLAEVHAEGAISALHGISDSIYLDALVKIPKLVAVRNS